MGTVSPDSDTRECPISHVQVPVGDFDVTNQVAALFIDLIDARRKELAWQGIGTGILSYSKSVEKKEAKINDFVTRIMMAYPPELGQVSN